MEHKRGRYFFAIPIPEHLKMDLESVQRGLRGCCHDFRWVDRELMHITLLFLGDQSYEDSMDLGRNIRKELTEQGAFNAFLGGVGAFPNLERPRVLWLGISQGTESIGRLNRIITHQADRLGLLQQNESPRFHAHVTMARAKKSGQSRITGALHEIPLCIQDPLPVERVELIASQLTNTGPQYTIEDIYYLQK